MLRGEIWWADMPDPVGSEPGFERPVVIVQTNRFNNSRIDTVIVAAITSNLQRGDAPGNVFVDQTRSGLSKDSIVNVSQIATLDRYDLLRRMGKLPNDIMSSVDSGLRLALDL